MNASFLPSGETARSVSPCVNVRCSAPPPIAAPRTVIGTSFAERLATWLGAEFEPFGAHSHYGLIVGEEGYTQVADAIRGFLEAHRL